MKKIALILFVICSLLGAGCSRPPEPAPVVIASPTPPQLTDEEQRQKTAVTKAAQERKRVDEVVAEPAVPDAGPALRAQVPIPSASPKR